MNVPLDPVCTPFSLEQTLSCGQSFRWEKFGDWWYGVIRDKVIKIRQVNSRLEFETFRRDVNNAFVDKYFRLDDDLPYITSKIDKDKYIRRAIQNFYGLRITRQEPWECLISYICATHKNIPAIKKMILNLSKRFGKKVTFDGHDFYMFPKPKDLAKSSVKELKECKLGFRAIRVLRASRVVHEERLDLGVLKEMSYEEAQRELLSLPGVGQKVADCVLLFSLDKLEAFPVDVWIKRTMLRLYTDYFERSFVERVSSEKSIMPNEYRKISSFGRKHFGEYAGYAQEYLFALSRNNRRARRLVEYG